MLPLLLLLQDAPAMLPARLDLRNWHSVETVEAGGPACTLSLSPNFYGITVRYNGTPDDMEISFDSPGVHVLPSNVAIPLKVVINNQSRRATGSRVDRRLIFRLARTEAESDMARRGMIRILLSDPSIPDTLIARYRLSGSDYGTEIARFRACNAKMRTGQRINLASGR